MGRTVIRLISEDNEFQLVAAFRSPGHPDIGKDAGIVAGVGPLNLPLTKITEEALASADVLIDYSAPENSDALIQLAADAKIAMVIGTTGFSAEQEGRIRGASEEIPILQSGNMSRGISLVVAFVRQAARVLPDFDIEVVEMHHSAKMDAPSGTALLLGEAAAEARGVSLSANAVHGRAGQTGPRRETAIGFASLRGGTVVGEHEVIFAGPHERVILSHVAEDRSIFAKGALTAARWICERPPGLYTMADVLGLAS